MRRITIVLLSLLVVASMVLAACAPAATPTAAPKQEAPTQEVAKPAAGPVKIGLSFSDFATERWKPEATLMEKLLKDKGYDVMIQEANHDVKLQNDQIDNMVSQGAKALIIIAEDGDAASTAVDKAAQAGVKVIAYDRLIKTASVSAYISFDNVEVGRQQAAGVLKALDIDNRKDPVKMVKLGGSPTDNNAILFRKGQDEVLQKYVDSKKIEVVADQWVDNWDPANALKLMENILTAAGNKVDAVVASNDGTALGALQAMKAQKLAGVVPISGQDATADGCNSIVKGELTVTIFKDIRKLAPLATDLVDKLLKGETVSDLKKFTMADLTNDPAKKGDVNALFLPVVQVTKDNVFDEIVKSDFQSYDDVYRDIPEGSRPPKPGAVVAAPTKAAAPAAGGAIKELKIIWAEWDPSNYLQQLVNDYEKEAGVKVTVVQEPWGSFADRVFTEFAGKGGSYDLVIGDSQWLGQGATQGHFVELTDIFDTELNGKALSQPTVQYYAEYPAGSKKYWAYPTEGDAIGWSYRKDLFEDPKEMEGFKAKYGYDLAVPQDLNQLRDIAEWFNRPDKNQYGIAVYTQKDYDGLAMGIEEVLWNFGGDWGNYATGQVKGIVNSEDSIKAVDFYKGLYQFAPPGSSNDFYAESLNHFTSGEVAMAMNYFAFFPGLVNEKTNKFAKTTGFFSNPKGPKGDFTSLGGQGMSIISYISPERQAAAKDFLKWFAKTETQQKWADLGGYTCNADILKSEKFLANTPYNKAFSESMLKVKDFWNIPVYVELLNVAKVALHKFVVGGEGTAKEAMDAIAEAQDPILKDGGYQTEGAAAAPTAEAAAAEKPVAGSSGKIKIATQSPLSGGMSAVGGDIKNGAQLALEQLAQPLKDKGFTVELAPFDDQGNPDTGVANAKQIVSDPEVICVVGHYNSGVQIPSSEEYHNAGLANVSPANTNPKVTDRGYLEISRIVGRDDVQGQVGAQFAVSKGIKSAYVMHDKTAYGQGIAEFFRVEAEKQGIKVLGFEGTEEKANFDAILSPILAATPDVIYFGGMYDQSNVLFKQAREKGFKGMFLSDDGYDSPESVKIAGKALLDGGGTFYSTVSGPVALYPDAAKFAQDFKAKFNADPQPFAAQGFDSAGICLKAIEVAAQAAGGKVPTRAEVAKAVRAIKDFKGITGTINLNKNGDLTIAKYYVIQVVSDDPAKWSANPVAQTLDIAPPVK